MLASAGNIAGRVASSVVGWVTGEMVVNVDGNLADFMAGCVWMPLSSALLGNVAAGLVVFKYGAVAEIAVEVGLIADGRVAAPPCA